MNLINKVISGKVVKGTGTIETVYPLDTIIKPQDISSMVKCGNITHDDLLSIFTGGVISINILESDNSNTVLRVLKSLESLLHKVKIDTKTFYPIKEDSLELLEMVVVLDKRLGLLLQATLSFE